MSPCSGGLGEPSHRRGTGTKRLAHEPSILHQARFRRAWRILDAESEIRSLPGRRPLLQSCSGALGDRVDGEHFFDVVSDDIVYEVLYDFPGWPRTIQGRADLMAQFKGYGDNIELRSADNLITRRADDGGVFVIEYEVHGTILASGVKYDNRFCSISRSKTGESRAGETTWTLLQPGMH